MTAMEEDKDALVYKMLRALIIERGSTLGLRKAATPDMQGQHDIKLAKLFAEINAIISSPSFNYLRPLTMVKLHISPCRLG